MDTQWDPEKISFRKLKESDLKLMHQWFNTPHVSQWWKIDGKRNPGYEDVVRHFMLRIRGSDPTKCYIVVYNKIQVAFIQSALIKDNPRYEEALKIDGNIVGIDIFIGDKEYIHTGLGSLIIKAFLKDIAFKIYNTDLCSIDPDPENKIAIRAYEKSGFHYIKTVWNPIDKVWAYLMVINRESILQ